jgi:hypothetical protein
MLSRLLATASGADPFPFAVSCQGCCLAAVFINLLVVDTM